MSRNQQQQQPLSAAGWYYTDQGNTDAISTRGKVLLVLMVLSVSLMLYTNWTRIKPMIDNTSNKLHEVITGEKPKKKGVGLSSTIVLSIIGIIVVFGLIGVVYVIKKVGFSEKLEFVARLALALKALEYKNIPEMKTKVEEYIKYTKSYEFARLRPGSPKYIEVMKFKENLPPLGMTVDVNTWNPEH